MRMVWAGVDLELAQLLSAEAIPRQHPLDGAADHLFRPALQQSARAIPASGPAGSRCGGRTSCLELVRVTATRDALSTITWSPESIDGVYVGLFLPSRTRAICDARRPSVWSAASTTYQRRSTSLSRSVCRSGCYSSPSVIPSSSDRSVRSAVRTKDDPSQTESLAGATAPFRAGCREASASATAASSSFPADLQEGGHDSPDHLAQEGVGGDVDRHQRARPPDPDPMQGPDRLPVRRPEGAEVVSAHQDRPGPLHRGGIERDPNTRAQTARGSGCAARSTRCSGTPGTAPQSGDGTDEPHGRTPRTATSRGRMAAMARPSSSSASRPAHVNAITWSSACTPASVRPAPSTRTRAPRSTGQCGLELPLDRPSTRLRLEPGKVRASYSTRAV
jgi:hypothetical protein